VNEEEFTERREGSEGEKVERCCDAESATGSRSLSWRCTRFDCAENEGWSPGWSGRTGVSNL